jgi:hypothetical protein
MNSFEKRKKSSELLSTIWRICKS